MKKTEHDFVFPVPGDRPGPAVAGEAARAGLAAFALRILVDGPAGGRGAFAGSESILVQPARDDRRPEEHRWAPVNQVWIERHTVNSDIRRVSDTGTARQEQAGDTR